MAARHNATAPLFIRSLHFSARTVILINILLRGENNLSNCIIIGAGAAGMMCGILLGEKSHNVVILEQNERIGKKLYITGKGRCNFTNDCSRDEFLDSVKSNPRFLYSALDVCSPQDIIEKFESWGMRTKVERGKRAFPASDKSADVIDTLRKALKKNGVKVLLNTKVTEILTEKGAVCGVKAVTDGKTSTYTADHVIVATGGISYRSTGSTGDGYTFAEKLGLKVTQRYPSLVPMNCAEEYCRELQGLSLKNAALHIKKGKKEVYSGFGEMMFTHFGITGPLVLKASADLADVIGKEHLTSWIDTKPAVSEEQLDARILRLFEANVNKAVKNVINELYPAKMTPVILMLSGIDPDTKVHDITKEQRAAIIKATKELPITITALRGYEEAVVTKGGVSVREINPKTMESKKVPGLYFIGEVLDLDAYTGGFNLQIAWSTAAACAAELW